MRKAGISQAATKKVRINRKLPLRRWQAQTHRLMSNLKQILRAKCAGEALPWRERSLLRRQLPAISSKSSLEYGGNPPPRHRHRHLIASVEHHQDEHPTRIIATMHLVSSASDRTTLFVL